MEKERPEVPNGVISSRRGWERLKDWYRLEFAFNFVENFEVVSTLGITRGLKILSWVGILLEILFIFPLRCSWMEFVRVLIMIGKRVYARHYCSVARDIIARIHSIDDIVITTTIAWKSASWQNQRFKCNITTYKRITIEETITVKHGVDGWILLNSVIAQFLEFELKVPLKLP